MSLDSTNFPLVWMSYDEGPDPDHDEDFEAFEALLKRGAPFVLLTETAPAEDHEHSQDEKKRIVMWLKKHKEDLRTLVLAMIVIEPSAAKRLAFKAFGVAFSKFWGYPVWLSPSREDAMEVARVLLTGRAKPTTA